MSWKPASWKPVSWKPVSRRLIALAAPIAVSALLAVGSAPLVGDTARAASFDCTRARAADERAICGNRALEDRDVELATLYGLILRVVPMGSRDAIRDDQTAWLARRGRCGASVVCIRRSYDGRIAELRTIFEQRVVRNGPF